MILRILIITLIFLSTRINALNIFKVIKNQIDSNYIEFLRIKGLLGEEFNSYITDKKCGFRIINSVKLNIDQYSPDKRQKIQSVLQRPTKQSRLITPSGKFKIHYDTTGAHAIKYSVYELAKAIDSVYNFEINIMGFHPAPGDNGAGGDNLYDIYVHDISPIYGYTELENVIGPDIYSSFIVIDESFDESDYYTKGIDAARVTLAHEYHHAIQIGNYRYSEKDVWFYELTSTSMEEFVYDSVNDYYAYIPNFFNHPDKVFTKFDGYSQAIWNIYLYKIFDNNFSIFVRQWELIRNFSALESIKKSIEEKGKLFRQVFAQFYLYNYYTGYRSIPEQYYEEGSNYPLIKFYYPVHFIKPSRVINGIAQPCAANYYFVIDSLSKIPYPPDSIAIILVNSNVDSALNWTNSSSPFHYSIKIISDQSDFSFKQISDNLYSKLEVNDLSNWTDFYIVNNSTYPVILAEVTRLAFPMPANLNKYSFISIPVPADWKGEVDLLIYSIGMDLIHSSKKTPQIFDNKVVVQWDGKDLSNKKVSSGIYFYTIVFGDNKNVGKIVVVNE